MDKIDFTFKVVEYFRLSTGNIALVGIMDPINHPIIMPNEFVVEIKTSSGKSFTFNEISEDLFSRSKTAPPENYRSLQTNDDIGEFVDNIETDPIVIYGIKKV